MAAGATVDVGILVTMKNALTAPFRRLNKDIEKVGKTSQATARRLRAIQVVIAAIIAGKLKQFASQVLELASNFESVTRQLTIFTGSADQARKEMDELRKTFANTAFSIFDVTQALVRFKAAGVPDATFAVKALADAVSAFGGGKDELDRASVAIQQIAGKGVVSMEELRQQLGEAIPFALKVLAKSTNRNMGQLINDIQQGKISADEFNASFFKGLDEAFGGASEIPGLKVSIAKFKKAWQNGITDIFQNTTVGEQFGIIIERLAERVTAFFAAIDQGDMDRFIDIFRKWVVILENTWDALQPLIGLLGSLFGILTDILVLVSTYIKKYPLGLVSWFGKSEAWQDVKGGLSGVGDGLQSVWDIAESIWKWTSGAGLIGWLIWGRTDTKRVSKKLPMA